MLGSALTATGTAYPFRSILDTRTQNPMSSPVDAIRRSSCRLAWDAGAKAIVILSGSAALLHAVSRFRPPMPIIMLAKNRATAQQMALSSGVRPVFMERRVPESSESARRWPLKNLLAHIDDWMVRINPQDKRKDELEFSIPSTGLYPNLLP